MEELLEMTENAGRALAHLPEIMQKISDEFTKADTVEKREALLQLRHTLLALVESTVAAESLDEFRAATAKQYSAYIVEECLVGQNICVDTLDAVTRREVAAGRMSPDHNLRKHAAEAVLEPHFSREELIQQAMPQPAPEPEPKKGFGGFVSKLFKR
jgi:hypothetical protein